MATTQEPKAKKWLRPIPLGWATFWLAVVALVMVAVLGRYETRRDGYNGAIWRIDRWTGEVVLCGWAGGNPFCRKFPPPYAPLKPWERNYAPPESAKPDRPIDLSEFLKPLPENR